MSELTPRQHKFLLALLESSSIEQAIDKTNLGRGTAYKYLAQADFKQAYTDARREAMSRTTARLQQSAEQAVDTIIKIMNDEETPAHTRLQSAKEILNNAYKGLELEDIMIRVQELEEQLKAEKEGRR